jgi:hypothetical protein
METSQTKPPTTDESGPTPAPVWRLIRILGGLLLIYLLIAYVLLPLAWRRDLRRHPDLSGGPRITHTANGIPGDPVNIALLGSDADIVQAMRAARWFPADPITMRTSLRIAADSVFRRPDDEAPVSDLFLFGCKQDLAFEQPVGDSPRQRHHVRFWRWDRQHDNRDIWFGAATFDERVGFSHTTGQVTHHIGPDVDAERNRIMTEIQQAKHAQEEYYLDDFHKELQGKNGGGDLWKTDSRLGCVILVQGTNTSKTASNPAATQ